MSHQGHRGTSSLCMHSSLPDTCTDVLPVGHFCVVSLPDDTLANGQRGLCELMTSLHLRNGHSIKKLYLQIMTHTSRSEASPSPLLLGPTQLHTTPAPSPLPSSLLTAPHFELSGGQWLVH